MRAIVIRLAAAVAAIAAVITSLQVGQVAQSGESRVRLAAAQCSLAPTAGTVVRTIGTRIYRLNVPAGLTGHSVPLLLAEHGNASNAAEFEQVSGWTPYAAAHHFIVAYPQGNANNLPLDPGNGLVGNDWEFQQGSIDVQFLRSVVADIEANWCVDTARVYSSGWSDGGIMSQRLACDASDVFADVTSWEGGDPTLPNPTLLIPSPGSPCHPARPISVVIAQGQIDPISDPVAGVANVNAWAGRDGCPLPPAKSSDAFGTTAAYGPCRSATSVQYRVENGQAHQWPSGATGEDLRDRLWNFMFATTLP
ncbi:alpha/beta hydrolase family esterase [Nocardia africana]|uniref:Alpha/beta hydrolase family esterase n=1 Tax=Nocardia africana TaxID=134964 RepID=A0ABW6NR73_9NOCA